MFFTRLLVVYTLINAYIFFRGFIVLAGRGRWVVGLKALFVALAVGFPLMHWLEDTLHGAAWDVANAIGSFWAVGMVYFFLIVFLSDLVRLLDRIVPLIPERLRKYRRSAGPALFFGAVALVVLVVFFGWLNTRFIRVEPITVDLARLSKSHNPTTVVFASDLHIAPGVTESRIRAFVEKINAQNPDVILIGGDLVEGSVSGLGFAVPILSELDAPLGVWAVPGNHEYHGGGENALRFMEAADITVLRDEVVTIPGIVTIVGLDDPRSGNRPTPLPDLMARRDDRLPVILLTHRPINVEEYAAEGVDLMLAGHSHHGQFFPITIVTDFVYTVSYGQARIGPMELYVTSGLGTWGPPVRILTHPEIVRITLVNK